MYSCGVQQFRSAGIRVIRLLASDKIVSVRISILNRKPFFSEQFIVNMESVISERKNHYKAHTVWVVFGVSWGAVSYAYAGSVIGTTLGE